MKTLRIMALTFLIISILSTEIFAFGQIFTQVDSWEQTGKDNKDGKMDGTRSRRNVKWII